MKGSLAAKIAGIGTRKQRVVTMVALDDAIMRCSRAAAREASPDRPGDRLGAAWESAHRFAYVHAQAPYVQRGSGTMRGILDAARRGAGMGDGESGGWHATSPATPFEELDAELSARWLDRAIDDLGPRRARILRDVLGTVDHPVSRLATAAELGISGSRVSQIVDRSLLLLARQWSAGLKESHRLLEGVPVFPEPAPAPDPAPAPTARILAPIPRSAAPPRVRRARPVMALPEGIAVDDLAVRRIGEDRYRIEPPERIVDAAGVAAAIRSSTPDDHAFARLRVAVEKHDTFVADEMRTILRGPVWPTPALQRKALPLVPQERPA